MCLASDPPCRPEECDGVCEVWNGERWTVADSVTVLVSGIDFVTQGDLDMFCIDETKGMLERLEASLARSLQVLSARQKSEEDQAKQEAAALKDANGAAKAAPKKMK